jgi:hypothetical protein
MQLLNAKQHCARSCVGIEATLRNECRMPARRIMKIATDIRPFYFVACDNSLGEILISRLLINIL